MSSQPHEHPYPDQVVLDRWLEVLAEPTVTTLVAEDERGSRRSPPSTSRRCSTSACAPTSWGSGLAATTMDQVSSTRLWCLRENHRARRFYERLGWRTTGHEKPETFPPFPVLLEYERPVS